MLTNLTRKFTEFDKLFNQFDLLFKNFYETDSIFTPAAESRFNYPVDIYEDDHSVILEIAVVGSKKEDVQIEIAGENYLRIFSKEDHNWNNGLSKEENEKKLIKQKKNEGYIHKGISRKSFDFGWKISNKFDINKIEANMEDGLLTVKIPRAEEKEVIKKLIEIK